MDAEPFEWILDFCESRIECLAVLGLLANDWRPLEKEPDVIARQPRLTTDEAFETIHELPPAPGEELCLLLASVASPGTRTLFRFGCVCEPMAVLQAVPIGLPYRLDVAVFVGPHKFAVELDGHDWHERLKEQVARDKARDRALTMAGWRVLRFAGSEVWADPEIVATTIAHFSSEEDERIARTG